MKRCTVSNSCSFLWQLDSFFSFFFLFSVVWNQTFPFWSWITMKKRFVWLNINYNLFIHLIYHTYFVFKSFDLLKLFRSSRFFDFYWQIILKLWEGEATHNYNALFILYDVTRECSYFDFNILMEFSFCYFSNISQTFLKHFSNISQTGRDSFEEAIKKLMKERNKHPKVPIMLIANKTDLINER